MLKNFFAVLNFEDKHEIQIFNLQVQCFRYLELFQSEEIFFVLAFCRTCNLWLSKCDPENVDFWKGVWILIKYDKACIKGYTWDWKLIIQPYTFTWERMTQAISLNLYRKFITTILYLREFKLEVIKFFWLFASGIVLLRYEFVSNMQFLLCLWDCN